MGKKTQKRGGKAPRRTPPPVPVIEPTSSDEEYATMDHASLVERCKALEREKKEREALRNDPGEGASGTGPTRVFDRPGRGALMQRALPSKSPSRATRDVPVPVPRAEPPRRRGAAVVQPAVEGEDGAGEEDIEEVADLAACWEEGEECPVPPKKPVAPQQWGFPSWGPPCFPWGSPYGMAGMEPPWWAWQGKTKKPKVPAAVDDVDAAQFPFWPNWVGGRPPSWGEEDDGADVHPFGSVDLPLGGHLAMAVKHKIWRGEYVDLFSLLHTEPEPVPRVGEPERDQELVRKRKIDQNWTNWLYGYCIYMAVVVQLKPKRAPALIKYLDIVHRTLRDFGGQAWLQYDQNFRLRAANDPALSWAVPKFELWMQVVTPAKPITGDRSDSGHLIARNAASTPRAPSGAQGVQNQRNCYEYNATGQCSRPTCGFGHLCGFCTGRHPATACPRSRSWFKGGAGRGAKKGNGGAAPAASGKGPNPN